MYAHLIDNKCVCAGFDKYYRSLRPRMDNDKCANASSLPIDANGKRINCRNIWFREFWSQHHKCAFNESKLPRCTGNETINEYEQEGLVPFVG